MRITIITVSYNAAATIEDTIRSVALQTYREVEYIIVDGGSTDGTVAVINRHCDIVSRFISEPDKGIYDAMNKGIRMATGDIIGFLNADDFYASPDILAEVAQYFEDSGIASVFGDLIIVDRVQPDRIMRYYDSSHFNPDRFAFGWMPAHPTFFVRREVYNKYGMFKTDYKIAADFELLLRFLKVHAISYSYLPKVMIKMRSGGVSTRGWRSNMLLNSEILRACRENRIASNWLLLLLKYPIKIKGVLFRNLIYKKKQRSSEKVLDCW